VAGRTLFFNIHERRWDQDLLHLFNVPERILPDIQPTCGFYGHYRFRKRMIPVTCSIGDHQAALLGLGGFEKGECGLNYGTSGGVLVNIGPTPQIMEGLLTNIAYSDRRQAVYTSEGTVNAVGSLFEWFEKEKGIKGASLHWEQQVAPSSQGWFLIPGMYGIAAPYWKDTVVTEFRGKGGLPTREVELRAGMESIAFLVADILDRIRKIPALSIERITAAGGAARKPLLQFQADLLGIPVYHSSIADATAMGCAFLTGLQNGFWKGIEEIQSLVQRNEVFLPAMPADQRQSLLNQWHQHLKAEGIFI
jgi:glycerol kinase